MRKSLLIVSVVIMLSLMTGCGKQASPNVSDIDDTSSTNTATENTDGQTELTEPQTPTASEPSGSSNSAKPAKPDDRTEIAKMIKDAQELINEDMTDDAAMLIRDLLTRDLTDEEREQIKALQEKVVKISD